MTYADRITAARARRGEPWTNNDILALAKASYLSGYADGWDDSIPDLPYPDDLSASVKEDVDVLLARIRKP